MQPLQHILHSVTAPSVSICDEILVKNPKGHGNAETLVFPTMYRNIVSTYVNIF